MSVHIEAKIGEIAGTVLLPGDPKRAEYIAKKFLKNVKQYNGVRNMSGFTGFGPRGDRVSVQGSGIGMPSLSIYANELIKEYGVKRIIRLGTCGALQADIKLKEIVIAAGACSDSGINRRRFKGMNFAPLADWTLLRDAYEAAKRLAIPARVGNILSADLFYNDIDSEEWKLWAKYGVLAVEMETAELYTLAARERIQALSIFTVSDSLPNGDLLTSEEREKTIENMVKIALRIL